jgi:hypothetical protein
MREKRAELYQSSLGKSGIFNPGKYFDMHPQLEIWLSRFGSVLLYAAIGFELYLAIIRNRR